MTQGGYQEFSLKWHREDDGTYSKIKVLYERGHWSRIEKVTVIEEGITEREYFRRKLANEL